jgi:hypothetical protein
MMLVWDAGASSLSRKGAPRWALLRRLGGGEDHPNRPPGKLVLTRGLRRLLDHLAMEAILAGEERRHGGLPPRIAALLGRPAASG